MAWNKELIRGSRMKVDSYGTRPEGNISEAAQIGNHVGIEKSLGTEVIA